MSGYKTIKWSGNVQFVPKKYSFGSKCYIEFSVWSIPEIVITTKGKTKRHSIPLPILAALLKNLTEMLSKPFPEGKKHIEFRYNPDKKKKTGQWIKLSRPRCQKLVEAIHALFSDKTPTKIKSISKKSVITQVVNYATDVAGTFTKKRAIKG